MNRLHAKYEFLPVGQGLFATGALECSWSSKAFSWVYDCGTSSRQALIRSAVDRFRSSSHSRKGALDLLAISHFDKDHVSGLIHLLQNSTLDMLLLPYMSPEHRMALARLEGVGSNHPLHAFFVNPVRFLVERRGVEVSRIVLVPGGSTEVGDDDEPNLEDLQITPDVGEPDPEAREDFQAMEEAAFKAGVQVHMLRRGGRLRVAGVWEFVPYNDSEMSPLVTADFKANVSAAVANLFGRAGVQERHILNIQRLYDNQFGDKSKDRNLISLFLYAGPIREQLQQVEECRRFIDQRWRHARIKEPCFGALYTGDGFLDCPGRLQAMLRHFGPKRIERLACLQVMHHGSRRNFYPGVANSLQPIWSVFSSDPGHKRFRHPHAEVWNSFSSCGPVQVDRLRGARFEALMAF